MHRVIAGWRAIVGLVFAAAAVSASASVAQAPSVVRVPAESRFDGWAAAVIAADWRDGRGRPIAAFDNARRDLSAELIRAGFRRDHLVDVSLAPTTERPVSGEEAMQAFSETAARATGGCLLYFTSHGAPDHMVFGPGGRMTPAALAPMVRASCGQRPTVVVISACFSGQFVDGLAAPNRMILTAARRDRASFGCGADFDYTVFDGCVIRSLPGASDFIALANAVRACVKQREIADNLSPASEPQTSIGATMQFLLPTLRFSHPPPGGGDGGASSGS